MQPCLTELLNSVINMAIRYSETDLSTEKQILEAAEKVFLHKGFVASKTTEIAENAGVNHALLHYYFRTKENLFNTVFQEKMGVLINSFKGIFEKNLSLFELLESIIGTQYDFLLQNERLPFFIINEMIANEKNCKIFISLFLYEMKDRFVVLQALLDEEIAKGTIRPVKLIDLMLTIVSLNVSFFMLQPLINSLPKDLQTVNIEILKSERKKAHVELVLNWIRK